MKKNILFLILLSFFLCHMAAAADFYKWIDEKGETQITDYPPPEDMKAKNVEVHKYQSEQSVAANADAGKAVPGKAADVVIYTKNNCADCDKARDFLVSQKIPFTEYNMDNDPNAVNKRKEIDNSEDVPFAIINRNQVYGFQQSVYERVLKMVQ